MDAELVLWPAMTCSRRQESDFVIESPIELLEADEIQCPWLQ
jgi:hypothetical protein